MIWLLVVVVVAVVVVALVSVLSDCARSQKGVTSYETMVELHGIRRRSEVAQVKTQLRSDAADAQRKLRDELDGLNRGRV